MCTRVCIRIIYSYPLYKIYVFIYKIYVQEFVSCIHNNKNTKLSEKIYTTNITCTNRRKKFKKFTTIECNFCILSHSFVLFSVYCANKIQQYDLFLQLQVCLYCCLQYVVH